jgi:hypothetical protein
VNLTLSIDEQLVERARAVAREQGTSLNALIRAYIESLAGEVSGEAVLEQFQQMWRSPGNSGGKRFDRDAIYDERTNRYKSR